MSDTPADWTPLLLAAATSMAMRAAGFLAARRLDPGHPFVAWAASVGEAALSAYVALSLFAPAGALAGLPAAARLGGTAAGVLVFLLAGRRLLPATLAGLLLAWALSGVGR